MKSMLMTNVSNMIEVAPCAGAGIETSGVPAWKAAQRVAPCAGAGIETCITGFGRWRRSSPPARGRGLKYGHVRH